MFELTRLENSIHIHLSTFEPNKYSRRVGFEGRIYYLGPLVNSAKEENIFRALEKKLEAVVQKREIWERSI